MNEECKNYYKILSLNNEININTYCTDISLSSYKENDNIIYYKKIIN